MRVYRSKFKAEYGYIIGFFWDRKVKSFFFCFFGFVLCFDFMLGKLNDEDLNPMRSINLGNAVAIIRDSEKVVYLVEGIEITKYYTSPGLLYFKTKKEG